jgi:hypothetical protein
MKFALALVAVLALSAVAFADDAATTTEHTTTTTGTKMDKDEASEHHGKMDKDEASEHHGAMNHKAKKHTMKHTAKHADGSMTEKTEKTTEAPAHAE